MILIKEIELLPSGLYKIVLPSGDSLVGDYASTSIALLKTILRGEANGG